MPLLGGIFKKKSRTQVSDGQYSHSPSSAKSDADSTLSSPTSEYIKTDTAIPSSPNGSNTLHPNNNLSSRSLYPNAAASSSRLKLGFGRKKGSAAGSAVGSTHDDEDYFAPPRPNFSGRKSTSAASDSDLTQVRPLGPPPSKSALFAAQEGALSTRSLPNETVSQTVSTHSPVPSKKRPSIFPWSTKSQPSTTSKASSKQLKSNDVLSPITANEDSFNLKSFRHVRAPSTEPPLNSSSSSLIPPPVPGARPRNGSVGSDSSQRISVAAFREAQARRSAAGSPVPSLRSPSPHGIPSLPLSQSSLGDTPHTHPRLGNSPPKQRRRSSLALGYTSSDDEEESSEEESEDDEDGTGLSRRRTVTHRMNSGGSGVDGKNRGRATQSELGHGSSSSSSTHQFNRGDGGLAQSPRSTLQSNANVNVSGVRPRASASTSAITPNAAAKRASVLAAANSEMAMAHVQEKSNPSTKTSSQDSDESEDDAPLATLVAPRRPGSALSLGPNTSQPNRPKPLIDINTLAGPNKRPPESGAKSQAGFTGGSTLLSGVGSSQPSASAMSSVTSTSPPIRFISPPSSPKGTYKALSSAPASNSAPQTPSSRKAPARKDTDTSSIVTTNTSSSGGQSAQDSGKKRDNLSERLNRVTQTRLGSSSPFNSPFNSPSINAKPSGPDSGGGGGGGAVIPRTTSPVQLTESPVATGQTNGWHGRGHGHRRASSDYTLRLDTYTSASTSSSPPPSSVLPQSSTVTSPISAISATDAKEEEEEMEDLASLLGPGIKLVTRNGEDPPESPEALKPDLPPFRREAPASPGRIAPVVIKERPPVSSFSVTSRPQNKQSLSVGEGVMEKKMTTTTTTTTILTASSSETSSSSSTTSTMRAAITLNDPPIASTRQRSTTVTAAVTPTTSEISTITQSKSSSSIAAPVPKLVPVAKPRAPVKRTTVVSSSSESSSSSSSEESESESEQPKQLSSVPPTQGSGSGSAASEASSSPPVSRRTANPNSNINTSQRPRSSTMSNLVPVAASQSLPTWNNPHARPTKPFAVSRESPASSTGDSSSGRVPTTPGDGSDIGGSDFGGRFSSSQDSSASRPKVARHDSPYNSQQKQYSGGASGLGLNKQHKRASVSFDEKTISKALGNQTPEEEEERRRERRRSEAKAAIELGNVINGRGPVDDDDDDDDLPISQTAPGMGTMNPMMTGAMPMMPGFPSQAGTPGWGSWPQMPPANPQMAQFMVPPPNDPAFFAAHQQAMMIAKQAYQMAVAQQAMAAAAEEWERGSTIGGFSSSQSMYGGVSNSPMMGSPYGMGMGMGMGGGNGWSTGSVIFPSGPRSSVYGGGAQSEYGGGGGRGGGWNSSRSVYGESFGPSSTPERQNRPSFGQRSSVFNPRDSSYFPPVPPIPQQHKNSSRPSPPAAASAAGNPRNRAISQPSSPARPQKKAPPSSWKAGI
ncbi:hypothetical protein K435DRAFT_974010 [Dendrothele bispora CBS 962.96]|uniref:Uncharacterized protein n=1 Tax=Dendrothele bispora (strain CBS 962.96) TaxID=1314807 RepID=A0A4S8KNV8_DENBC|nr:hypothetical protein K435DRAFT_974010 [Dendrothele bispora CBS 962.96]